MKTDPELSAQERIRYSRHLTLPEVGSAGQRKLKGSSVLVVGAGGLGSPIILYLAAAGVGKIGIADFDEIDVSNLQRQILYASTDVDQSKVNTACRKAAQLNPEIEVVAHDAQVTANNVMELVQNYDVIADGSDNFATRYLINDACILSKKPNVHGAIHRFEGQATVFAAHGGPCYRCIFRQPPAEGTILNCAAAGVLGVLPGIVGSIQATECIKLLLSIGSSLVGRLLLVDALEMQFRTIKLKADPECTVCGEAPTITTPFQCAVSDAFCHDVREVSAAQLAVELSAQLHDQDNGNMVLLDVRDQNEFDFSHLQQAVHIALIDLLARADIPGSLQELSEKQIVVYCLGGTRSRKAAEILQAAGLENVRHLKGGIRAWQQEIDLSFSYLE